MINNVSLTNLYSVNKYISCSFELEGPKERGVCSCNGVSFTHFTGKPWLGFNGLGWYDNRARVLDALTGRFTTSDPLAERYPWESPYLFCSGNPVKMVDEDGKDGIVSIYGPKISISANIYLYGSGANSYVRDTFQSGINSKWSNRTYSIQHNNKVFQTSVEGNVYLQRGLYPIGRFSPWDRNNYVYVSDDIKTSTVNNYGIDYNEWRSRGRNGESLSQDNPAPHEFGHLLGLPDMYYKDTQEPISGWEYNIMGNSQHGKVEQINIEPILEQVFKSYDE